ncbi:kelch-like protein 10 [Melanerpes formicivorus]|uniref:kelch-like protein 10 n=1 Tax=Melanerpes formicivorus TaxID=211600 RepID=UPI00358F707A
MEGNTSPSTFSEILQEGEHCDATLRVDGVEFNVHKVVLSGCSDYFRTLFSSRWNETKKRVYEIHGFSAEVMKQIIKYIYTGTVPVAWHNVRDLLVMADYLQVTGLIKLCGEFLKSQLSLENCLDIWRFTDTYYCPDLREAAFIFILHHFKQMAEVSPKFVNLSVNDLKAIIEKDELNVGHEGIVFESVLKWVDHDPQNRRQHVPVLLSKVRLALMPAEYFLTNVQTHHYVRDNEDCKSLIINALTEMYQLSMNGPASGVVTPLSQPRLPYSVLFAIGGWSGESPTNAIEVYDPRVDQWVDVIPSDEGPLAYHNAAYLKGFIYIIGGFDSVDCSSSVKRFDLLQKTWQEVAPMHFKRCYVSVAVLDDVIYAMGGFDGHVRLNTAERYDAETNQWTMIAPMHEQRSDASAASLHDKVYICGGFNGTECLITAEVYDVATNQWSFIAPMITRRSGVGVITYDNEVYAVGGFNGFRRLRSAEAYSPEADAWHPVASMLCPRSNFGIEVVDDHLFVVGGFNGFTTTFNAEYYDKATNEWYDIRDMRTHRSALSCTVVSGLLNVRDYVAR